MLVPWQPIVQVLPREPPFPHFPGPSRSPSTASGERLAPSRVSALFCVPFLGCDWESPTSRLSSEMARVYVGNLDARVTERELEDEFRVFGVLRSVWVARKPPGFAFVDFDDQRDAQDAVREVDGKNGWRVEMSRRGGGRGPGRDRSRGSDMKCYECGESGHFARECRLRIGSRGLGSGARRSPSPRYRRSPSYGRRSYSRDRSPRRRSVSPRRRSYSKSRSPPYKQQAREESPYANGNSDAREERRSRS